MHDILVSTRWNRRGRGRETGASDRPQRERKGAGGERSTPVTAWPVC